MYASRLGVTATSGSEEGESATTATSRPGFPRKPPLLSEARVCVSTQSAYATWALSSAST